MRKNKKVAKLLLRVMRLNAIAPKDVYYSFNFYGHTNQVDFTKSERLTFKVLESTTAYLNNDNLCYPLSYVERAIEKEEKLCRYMTNI